MGLDMYLTARINLAGDENVRVEGLDSKGLELGAAEYDLGYWRKANAIHGWFVKNVQEGVDDCSPYQAKIEDLRALRDLCAKVLRDRAPEHLPPTAGFFFGSTDVDEYYWDDLHLTIDICNKACELADSTKNQRRYWRFTYQSSW